MMERITAFFEKLKNFSIWERLFSWKLIKELSGSTLDEIKEIEQKVDNLERQLIDKRAKNKVLANEINILEKQVLIQEKSEPINLMYSIPIEIDEIENLMSS